MMQGYISKFDLYGCPATSQVNHPLGMFTTVALECNTFSSQLVLSSSHSSIYRSEARFVA